MKSIRSYLAVLGVAALVLGIGGFDLGPNQPVLIGVTQGSKTPPPPVPDTQD